MSTGNPSPDDNPGSAPPKKRSLLRILLFVGLFGFGGLLLCCCGLFFWLSRTTTDDPVEVRARTQQIAKIDFPERFQPALGMKVNIPVFPSVDMVVWIAGARSGAVMLMELGKGANVAIEQQMIRAFSQTSGGEQTFFDLNIEQKSEEEFEIRGQKVNAEFAEGKDRRTGVAVKQVTVRFPGRNGSSTLLLIQLPAEDWDDDEIRDIIDSIE